jgi:hypothetical protein
MSGAPADAKTRRVRFWGRLRAVGGAPDLAWQMTT